MGDALSFGKQKHYHLKLDSIKQFSKTTEGQIVLLGASATFVGLPKVISGKPISQNSMRYLMRKSQKLMPQIQQKMKIAIDNFFEKLFQN